MHLIETIAITAKNITNANPNILNDCSEFVKSTNLVFPVSFVLLRLPGMFKGTVKLF